MKLLYAFPVRNIKATAYRLPTTIENSKPNTILAVSDLKNISDKLDASLEIGNIERMITAVTVVANIILHISNCFYKYKKKMKTISEEGIVINRRFFEAIEFLRNEKKIRGVQTITRGMNINRSSMTLARLKPERFTIRPEWIVYLAKNYNVSIPWIMTGQGSVFQ